MLTHEQKEQLREDGYLHLPGAVSRDLIDNALHHIYWKIGGGFTSEQLKTWTSQSFFPDLAHSAPISDLFNASGLLETARNLLGEEEVKPGSAGQLALRFPREPGVQAGPPRPHIDGLHSPNNGVPAGTLGSFTALVGVFLTDVPHENAGNFTVWPGSHRKLEEKLREIGTEGLLRGEMPPLDLGAPLQLNVQAGDAAICHYMLSHSAASNVATQPRFATFFRLKHPQHNAHRHEILTDIWREWEGIKE